MVEELKKQLEEPLNQAVSGALNKALRRRRPKFRDINWQRTIWSNLKHYQPKYNTVVPETLVGHGRRRNSLLDVVLCIDQSSSMISSVVYAGIFGAVMAALPAVNTSVVVFSTSVVDLTAEMHDPVDMLFGLQLRGGTDINRAIAYSRRLVKRPGQTVFVLISDLYEGGDKKGTLRQMAELKQSGTNCIVLLALNDAGAPRFNREMAESLADLGIPSFACTPGEFPGVMAGAINHNLGQSY